MMVVTVATTTATNAGGTTCSTFGVQTFQRAIMAIVRKPIRAASSITLFGSGVNPAISDVGRAIKFFKPLGIGFPSSMI